MTYTHNDLVKLEIWAGVLNQRAAEPQSIDHRAAEI